VRKTERIGVGSVGWETDFDSNIPPWLHSQQIMTEEVEILPQVVEILPPLQAKIPPPKEMLNERHVERSGDIGDIVRTTVVMHTKIFFPTIVLILYLRTFQLCKAFSSSSSKLF
jgi:hypothetical protein